MVPTCPHYSEANGAHAHASEANDAPALASEANMSKLVRLMVPTCPL